MVCEIIWFPWSLSLASSVVCSLCNFPLLFHFPLPFYFPPWVEASWGHHQMQLPNLELSAIRIMSQISLSSIKKLPSLSCSVIATQNKLIQASRRELIMKKNWSLWKQKDDFRTKSLVLHLWLQDLHSEIWIDIFVYKQLKPFAFTKRNNLLPRRKKAISTVSSHI